MQRFFDNVEALAEFIFQQDALGRTTYHECAAFKTPANRKHENASGASSFWGDLDCGGEKPYPTWHVALAALADFCRQTGFPTPVVVISGYGIHFYWPLNETLAPDRWEQCARRLQQLFDKHGLNADRTRTADISSVLRTPSTHNRKDPLQIRRVQSGPLVGPYELKTFSLLQDVERVTQIQAHDGSGSPTADARSRLAIAAANTSAPSPYTEEEEARLRSALACIPATDRKTWLNVGMGIHWLGWEKAFQIWDDWSQKAPEKYNERDQERTWKNFDRPYDGLRITVATIFHLAKEFGWTDEAITEKHPTTTNVSESDRAQLSAKAFNWNEQTITAPELHAMTFTPIRYVVPGFVPEGLTLLVGRPKVGKSWLALDLCLACAGGWLTLGAIKAAPGDVLYLALEDGKRRLQRRIEKLMSQLGWEWPKRLRLVPAGCWRRSDQGGLADIEAWCNSVTNPVLVVIDTLERIRKPATGKSPQYSADYEAITGLQKIASDRSIAIIVLHHDRKAEADDAFDTVSGTLGLTGAADTILMLKRRSGGVILLARGRDIEESETALQFDKDTCRWRILGPAAEIQRSTERARVIEVLRATGQPLSIREIMTEAEMSNRNAVDILLSKMAKDSEIVRVGRGRYALISTFKKDGQKDRLNNQDADIATKTQKSDLSHLSGHRQ
jgi:hypothetical protein